ncbi:MAG: RsfS/YbeB/iojap family protein, partial [Chloroflexota bacterium]
MSAPKIGRPSSLSGSGGRRAGLPDRETVPGADLVARDAAGALELGRRIVDLAADKKAADIVLIGIAELTTVADYLVICSGSSERQLGAIADGIV